ncbi:hypothetical protein [Piscinibacter sp.]|uniref:hypothetical protein n=1 Tax=Piscinibacter sp. TaxID=1903157 RepID=UPI002BD48339|nr:hypothetical protein [Albitalea sp.]HUG25040.1 hypothetical protein [Albitalea sp.]
MKHDPHPLHLALGLLLWSVWFVAMYAGLSIACAVHPPPVEAGSATWINAGLGLLTLPTTALLLWAALRCWQSRVPPATAEAGTAARGRFVAQVAAGLYLAAAIGTAMVGLPLAVLPPCV